jgi:archaellum component FlaC
MELMESRWTDDRMDDLKHQVDELGGRMERGFAEQRSEMNTRFDRLENSLEMRFEKIDERFERVDARFERVDAHFETVDARFERVDAHFETVLERMDRRFEKVDGKFDAVHDQIACTHEAVNGLYAMLARFSLWFAGGMVVTIVSVLLTLWLR